MDPWEEGSVQSEVEKRLADLFDDSEEAPDAADAKSGLGGLPLRDLKAVVLSVDWEINDEILTRLAEEIERLKIRFGGDQVLLLFLQLLSSISRHVRTHKSRAHPDAVKLLNSVFLRMEQVVLSQGLTEEGRKRVLLGEVRKFKALKERIARLKAEADRVPVPPADVQGIPPGPQGIGVHAPSEGDAAVVAEPSGMPPHEALAWVVGEVKKAIRAEFEALRAELRSLMR